MQLEIVENNPVTSIDNSIVFKKASKVIHQPTLLENDKIKEYILALKNSDLKKTHKNLMLFNLLTAQRPVML